MDYKTQEMKKPVEGRIVESRGGGEYTIEMDGAEHSLRIIEMSPRGVEFILDQRYHMARYLQASTGEMDMVVDNVPITLNMHTNLDKVVYKNSGGGGGGAGGTQTGLKSQIPGKVVSIAVSEGDSVKSGDVICTLESMKMQVAVKAHRDGALKALKIKEGSTVAKGDIIADIA